METGKRGVKLACREDLDGKASALLVVDRKDIRVRGVISGGGEEKGWAAAEYMNMIKYKNKKSKRELTSDHLGDGDEKRRGETIYMTSGGGDVNRRRGGNGNHGQGRRWRLSL